MGCYLFIFKYNKPFIIFNNVDHLLYANVQIYGIYVYDAAIPQKIIPGQNTTFNLFKRVVEGFENFKV